jgi:hypothetical protein
MTMSGSTRSRHLNLTGVPHTLGVAVATCAMCGRPVSEHNRHVRFSLLDAVLALDDVRRHREHG